MLTYTFTTREKFLLALLVVVFGGLAWYYFIFAAVQLRTTQLDSEIVTAQEQIAASTQQIYELQSMRAEIEQYEAEGRTAVAMPPYDNTKNLMDTLNATIGVGQFRMSTDPLDVETLGVVKRGITVEFRSASYEAARAILDALAEGDYPCSVESVSITDDSARRNSTDDAPFVVTAHLTFYEEDADGRFAIYAVDDTEETADAA